MGQPGGGVTAEPYIDLGEITVGPGRADHRSSGRLADGPVRPPRWLVLAVVALLATFALLADAPAVSLRTVLTVPTPRGDFQVVGDILYVFDGSYPPSRVVAYGLREGRRLWQATAPAGETYEDVSQVGNRTLMAPNPCTTAHPVQTVAVDSATGRELWRQPGVPEQNVAGDKLVVMRRPGQTFGCSTRYPPAAAHWDAVDVTTGAVAWSLDMPAEIRTAFDSTDGNSEVDSNRDGYGGGARRVVLVAADGTASSMDLTTGAITGRAAFPELALPAGPAPLVDPIISAGPPDPSDPPDLTVAGGYAMVVRHTAGPDGTSMVDISAYDLVTLRHRWNARAAAGRADPRGGDYAGVSGCGSMLCLFGPAATVLLDPRDGAERWRTTLSMIASDGDRALFATQMDEGMAVLTGLTVRDLRTGGLRADLTGWQIFTGNRANSGTPILGFTAHSRTWFARLDLARARATAAASLPGFYYSCVGSGRYLVCRRIDGVVRAWRVPG